MKYLGNYSSLVSEELVDYLLKTKGSPQPDQIKDCYQAGFTEYTDKSLELHPNLYWEVFENKNEKCFIKWPVSLSNDYEEVITKLAPGNYLPMHVDPNPENCKRYFMALVDYDPGHILVWGNNIPKDYKKGDLWEFNNVMDLHGSSNISHTVRLVAHLTVWNVNE